MAVYQNLTNLSTDRPSFDKTLNRTIFFKYAKKSIVSSYILDYPSNFDWVDDSQQFKSKTFLVDLGFKCMSEYPLKNVFYRNTNIEKFPKNAHILNRFDFLSLRILKKSAFSNWFFGYRKVLRTIGSLDKFRYLSYLKYFWAYGYIRKRKTRKTVPGYLVSTSGLKVFLPAKVLGKYTKRFLFKLHKRFRRKRRRFGRKLKLLKLKRARGDKRAQRFLSRIEKVRARRRSRIKYTKSGRRLRFRVVYKLRGHRIRSRFYGLSILQNATRLYHDFFKNKHSSFRLNQKLLKPVKVSEGISPLDSHFRTIVRPVHSYSLNMFVSITNKFCSMKSLLRYRTKKKWKLFIKYLNLVKNS